MTASVTEPGPSQQDEIRTPSVLRRSLAASLRRPVLTVFVVALTARVLLALLIYVRFGGALFGDDQTYPQLARQKASGASANWDDYSRFLYNATATLTLPLTALYIAFGPVLLVGQLFVALFGALTAAFTAWLARIGWGVRAALFSGLAVALLPSQVLWSALTLKDALVWALVSGLAVVVTASAAASGRRYWIAAACAAALLLGLAFLRQHTLVVAVWAFGIASWFGRDPGRIRRGVTALVLGLTIPWVTGIGPAGLGLVTDPGSLEGRRANNAAGSATAFVRDTTGASPEEIALRLEEANTLAAERAEAARAAEEAAQARASAAAERARALEAQRRLELARASGRNADDPSLVEAQRVATEAARRAEAAEAAAAAEERAAQLAAEQAAARERGIAEQQATQAERRREDLDTAFGEGAPEVGSGGGLVGNARQLPRGLAVMLFAPYPWESTGNPRVDLARLEMALWYPLLALAAVGALALRRRADLLLFPLLAGGATVLLYALTEGNFGTAFRHRGEFVWVVALLAAAGLSMLRNARTSRSSRKQGGSASEPVH